MSKKIIALGTGAADATRYYQTSFLISEGSQNILIDTGGGSTLLTQLTKTHINIADIQSVFITHRHMDHIFGLFWLLRFRGTKIRKGKAPDLTIYASKRNIAFIKKISSYFLKNKITNLFDQEIKFISIDNLVDHNTGLWKLSFFNCQSTKEEQFGIKIIFDDKSSLAFVGDEPYRENMYKYCNNVDYIFLEAFCLESNRDQFKPEKINHSTVVEAAKTAQLLKAKNLFLFHTEDTATFGERKNLYTKEASKEFDGKVFILNDLEGINI